MLWLTPNQESEHNRIRGFSSQTDFTQLGCVTPSASAIAHFLLAQGSATLGLTQKVVTDSQDELWLACDDMDTLSSGSSAIMFRGMYMFTTPRAEWSAGWTWIGLSELRVGGLTRS
jgi:hypothetical protein